MSYELGTVLTSPVFSTKASGLPAQEGSITKQPKVYDSEGGYYNPLSEPAICPSSSGWFEQPDNIYNQTKDEETIQECCEATYVLCLCCQFCMALGEAFK